MGLLIYCVLLFLLFMECCALTCRSEHGPKDEELRKIFNNCLKQQEGTSKKGENRRHSADNDWKNRGNQWEKDNRSENREVMGNSDISKKDREGNKEHKGNSDRRNYERHDMNDDLETDRRHTNGRRENRMGNMDVTRRGNSGGINDMTTFGESLHLRDQDDSSQSDESGESSRNIYYSSAKPPRRYRREKRTEMNSGQRSQYNPHSHRTNGDHDHNQANEGRNSSDNSSNDIGKACVLHCFMENLHMTDDSGMPDRYLVTHALTKDEKNEDLLDFLQESIEECFQILDNENTDDKCEFAKNLLTCLSEKGRANCDDWSGKQTFVL